MAVASTRGVEICACRLQSDNAVMRVKQAPGPGLLADGGQLKLEGLWVYAGAALGSDKPTLL